MREIPVSTDVYAKIWSLRQPGEESEDAILRRVFDCGSTAEKAKNTEMGIGVSDARYNVHFREGFQIFRRYLGRDFCATATKGQWFLHNDNGRYGSLNELSRAIGSKTENAWVNWSYADNAGNHRKVSDLRDVATIGTRSVAGPFGAEDNSTPVTEVNQKSEHKTWAEDIVAALEMLGGQHAPLQKIYDATRKIRVANGRSVPATFEAVVRERLESHSSDSDSFKGIEDLFCMPQGKGVGMWGLRFKQGHSL